MEEEENQPQGQPGFWRRWWWAVLLIIIIVGVVMFLTGQKRGDSKGKEAAAEKTVSDGKIKTIPDAILANKFGFLGGGAEDDGKMIAEYGAKWVRPHPGVFVWDMMQASAGDEIDFSTADTMVKNFQGTELGTLATLWPFADWDQISGGTAANCKVSGNDEFLPRNDQKGRGSYIPEYRCKPVDWTAYQNWVTKVVERYDGDGVDDMAGLKLPIKYWEVMNEPDLTSPEPEPRLDFWMGNEADYAELLIKTYPTIKSADTEAKVLVAGAAGGDKHFLDFYRQVFKNTETHSAFDIANVHCISNDRQTRDFNVGAYKSMLDEFNLNQPIWVTEAEAMYGKSAEENYQNTKTSTAGAIAAGAGKIFFTRYQFDDFRKDMSEKTEKSSFDNTAKYRELIGGF